MAVTGELNDLSLAELIEFFCNQRKTGRLKVGYPHGDGYFYLQSGSVVHASIGVLDGVDAVFYALTLRNASFTFAPGLDAPQTTINQPWISVVLEGLRRMDEGLHPEDAFPAAAAAPVEINRVTEAPQPIQAKPSVVTAPPQVDIKPPAVEAAPPVLAKPIATAPLAVEIKPAVEAPQPIQVKPVVAPAPPIQAKPFVEAPLPVAAKPTAIVAQQFSKEVSKEAPVDSRATAKHSPSAVPDKIKPIIETPAFLAEAETASRFSYTPWKLSMIFAAVVAVIAVIAVPWGWYVRGKGAQAANETATPSVESPVPASSPTAVTNEPTTEAPNEATSPAASSETSDVAKQQRDARAREEARARMKAAENAAAVSSASPTAATNPRPMANNQAASSTTKKVTVQVTYDENGRVTQASGGDATALRIARQKRFPAGKAGSATITIPIN
jgi:Domain of unknown function (DUF4388)